MTDQFWHFFQGPNAETHMLHAWIDFARKGGTGGHENLLGFLEKSLLTEGLSSDEWGS